MKSFVMSEEPLIIFDVDGTLIKTTRRPPGEHPFVIAIRKACGIDVSMDIKKHGGMCDTKIIIDLLKTAGYTDKKIKENLEKCKQAVNDEYRIELENGEIEILPGVKDLLDKLKEKNAYLALGTGNLEERAIFRMEKLGFHYFEFGGFGSDCLERHCLIETAIIKAKERGFSDDGRVFVIGDTEKDIKAAKKVGVKVIAVATGRHTKEELEPYEPDYLLDDLSDIDQVMKIVYE